MADKATQIQTHTRTHALIPEKGGLTLWERRAEAVFFFYPAYPAAPLNSSFQTF